MDAEPGPNDKDTEDSDDDQGDVEDDDNVAQDVGYDSEIHRRSRDPGDTT
jgi:hypothetical protein